MTGYSEPRPIRARTFKDIYGGQGPRKLRVERPYRPFSPSMKGLLEQIAESQRRLQERHPKEGLPTREEVIELYEKNKKNPDAKDLPVIEIDGRKFKVDGYHSDLVSIDGYDRIPFHHLETKEQRKERKEKKNRKETRLESIERKEGRIGY